MDFATNEEISNYFSEKEESNNKYYEKESRSEQKGSRETDSGEMGKVHTGNESSPQTSNSPTNESQSRVREESPKSNEKSRGKTQSRTSGENSTTKKPKSQKGKQRLNPIDKSAFTKLVNRIKKAFPKTRIILDTDRMKTRLAELGEASILQIFPYRKSKDNHLEESFNQANKMFSEGIFLNEIWKKPVFFLGKTPITENGSGLIE